MDISEGCRIELAIALYRQHKGSEVKWSDDKEQWSEDKWSEDKWSEEVMKKSSEVRNTDEVKWGEMTRKRSEEKWQEREVKQRIKIQIKKWIIGSEVGDNNK